MKIKRGFTLIELMVTIAVLAIIATLAAPSFTQIIRKNQLQNDAHDFLNQVVEMRADAILKQKDLELSVDESKTDAWKPSIHTQWLTTPSVMTLTYSLMGTLRSNTNLCFVLKHVKDSNLKAVIIMRKNGMVIYNKTLNACPADLGDE